MRARACALLVALALLQPGAGVPADPADRPPTGIIADRAPFALTLDEFFAWNPKAATADARNIARVPLTPRFVAPVVQPGATTDPKVRVLYAPDGMNNLGNYLAPQSRFNLYTFTHWSQIDLFLWFAGTAQRPVNLPARPWIEAAHRNGVKVLGTVFFAPIAWGGAPATVERFLRRDAQEHFPAAAQLVRIARHYGFDGWLINAETDLPTGGKGTRAMIDFMAELRRMAPPGMEIHWYDAMLSDGRVDWQNALTPGNSAFLQDGTRRTADAMFLNYAWTTDGLRRSAALAERLGRSRYDLFVGADLWPQRDGAQAAFRNTGWLDAMRERPGGPALGSIALFAPNFAFNFAGDARTPRFSTFDGDPADVARFYAAEERLFAGERRNLARPRGEGWPGIASLAPVHGVAVPLPFRTSFNVGHGRVDMRAGRRIGGAWHDMSRQDVLPTWQFASVGGQAQVGYDFDRPYDGGASLRIVPDPAGGAATIPLYALRLPSSPRLGVEVTSLASGSGYALTLSMPDGRDHDLPLTASSRWRTQHWCVATNDGAVRLAAIIRAGTSGTLRLGAVSLTRTCAAGVTAVP